MSHDLETMLPEAVSICRGHSTILLSHYPLPPIEKSTSLETRPTFRQLYSLRRPLPPSTPPRLVWSGSPEPEDSLPSPPFSDIGSGDLSHHHNDDDDDISEQPHRSESPWRLGKLDLLEDPIESGVPVEVQAGGLVGFCSLKVVHAARSGKVPGKMPHNILKEALVLRQLGHPNIIKFLDYKSVPSSCCTTHILVLPTLAFSLRHLLNHLLPPNQRQVIFHATARSLLSALAYLHHLGLTHRDVCPGNIMFGWDGIVRLIDFGVCWDEREPDVGEEWKETDTNRCYSMGTGAYRAPELLFGDKTYDPQAVDIWAAGCTLAEFFTKFTTQTNPDNTQSPDSSGRRLSYFDATEGDMVLIGDIFNVLGTPNSYNWPDFDSLPDAKKLHFHPKQPKELITRLPDLESLTTHREILQLFEKMLRLDPHFRAPAWVLHDEMHEYEFEQEELKVILQPWYDQSIGILSKAAGKDIKR